MTEQPSGLRDGQTRHTRDTSVYICATCGRTLATRTDEHGTIVEYLHGLQDAHLSADHQPQPIAAQRGREQWAPRCDFCNLDTLTWRLPARDFEYPGFSGHISYGDWGACDTCAAHIEHNDWKGLVRRVIDTYPITRNEPIGPTVAASLPALYRALRKNITGALRRTYATATKDTA